MVWLVQATFNKNETAKFVCTKSYEKGDDDKQKKLRFLKRGIKKNYQHHWYILPLCYFTGTYCHCVISLVHIAIVLSLVHNAIVAFHC